MTHRINLHESKLRHYVTRLTVVIYEKQCGRYLNLYMYNTIVRVLYKSTSRMNSGDR